MAGGSGGSREGMNPTSPRGRRMPAPAPGRVLDVAFHKLGFTRLRRAPRLRRWPNGTNSGGDESEECRLPERGGGHLAAVFVLPSNHRLGRGAPTSGEFRPERYV